MTKRESMFHSKRELLKLTCLIWQSPSWNLPFIASQVSRNHRSSHHPREMGWRCVSLTSMLGLIAVLRQLFGCLSHPQQKHLSNKTSFGLYSNKTLRNYTTFILFFRGSSRPRDWTQVPCIAGRFFYRLSHQGSPIASTQLFLILQRTGLQPEWYHIMRLTQSFKDIILTFSYQEVDLPPSESESEGTQSCPTLCHPMDCSLPASSVYGIFQARILEWVAISCSRGSSQPRDQIPVSHTANRHSLSHQQSPDLLPRWTSKNSSILDLRAVCL